MQVCVYICFCEALISHGVNCHKLRAGRSGLRAKLHAKRSDMLSCVLRAACPACVCAACCVLRAVRNASRIGRRGMLPQSKHAIQTSMCHAVVQTIALTGRLILYI